MILEPEELEPNEEVELEEIEEEELEPEGLEPEEEVELEELELEKLQWKELEPSTTSFIAILHCTYTQWLDAATLFQAAWDHPAFFQEFRFRDMIQKLISGIKFVHNWAPWILEDRLGVDIIPIEVDRKFSEVTINGVFKFYLQFDLSYKLKKCATFR